MCGPGYYSSSTSILLWTMIPLTYWVCFWEMTAIHSPYTTRVTAQILFFWKPNFRGGPSSSRCSRGHSSSQKPCPPILLSDSHGHSNFDPFWKLASQLLLRFSDGYLSVFRCFSLCLLEKVNKTKWDRFREWTATADNEHQSESVWPLALLHGKLTPVWLC